MIKLVYCLTRRPDVTPERFHTYWLEKHGPKVRCCCSHGIDQ